MATSCSVGGEGGAFSRLESFAGTRSDGRFRLHSLSAGEWMLAASDEGRSTIPRMIDLAEGERRTGVQVLFDRDDATSQRAGLFSGT